MFITISALILLPSVCYGLFRFSSARNRRQAAKLRAIRAFIDANPCRSARAADVAPATGATIVFLDVYRDRAARLARSRADLSGRPHARARVHKSPRPA